MTTRREVLKAMAALAAAPSLAQALERTVRWGTATKVERIGLQLYTVRAALAKDVPGTIAAIAKAGVKEVEHFSLFGRPASEWRALQDANGLTSPSSHIGIDRFRKDAPGAFAEANALGNQYVVVPWLAPDARGKTADSWKRLAAELNTYAAQAKAAGLKFAYHNHDFEFQKVEGGVVPYDILTTETDPSLVHLELDLFWCTKEGIDPLALFTRWPGRFPAVHVKDRARDGKQSDVGAGTLPFATWFAQAPRAGTTHFFLEHDEPADPIGFVRNSAAWLSALRW